MQLNLISEAELKAALRIQKGAKTLGEILCDLKLINPLDLYYVLNKYRKQHRVGEVLVEMGYVSKEDLNPALQEQKHAPTPSAKSWSGRRSSPRPSSGKRFRGSQMLLSSPLKGFPTVRLKRRPWARS